MIFKNDIYLEYIRVRGRKSKLKDYLNKILLNLYLKKL